MASPPSEDDDFDDEDEDEDVEEGTEASRPCAVASQVKCTFTKAWLWNTFYYMLGVELFPFKHLDCF